MYLFTLKSSESKEFRLVNSRQMSGMKNTIQSEYKVPCSHVAGNPTNQKAETNDSFFFNSKQKFGEGHSFEMKKVRKHAKLKES